MDPSPPPPDTSDAAAAAIPAADPAPLLAVAGSHPPYDEMILAAITALKNGSGSSRKEMSEYIQHTYPDLPPNHSALLTLHLSNLKASGRIVMSKNAYRLAGPEGSSRGKRGRPRKSKAVLPYTAPKPVVLGLSDDEARKANEVSAAARKRGRGRARPVKVENSGQAEAAPALPENGAGRPKRARGRPAKVTMVPFASAGVDKLKVAKGRIEKLPVRRRGRPTRSTAAAGRPAGQKKPGGRSAAVAAPHAYGVEYEILQKKVEIIQTRIKDAVAILKPHLAGEASTNAMAAIIELEAIAALDIKASLTGDLNATMS